MTPACPPDYSCTFTPDRPPAYDVWWEGPWGIVVMILALIALVAIIGTVSYHLWQRHTESLRAKEKERERMHVLAVEEQRTMQLDAAKGDPEALRIVRDMQQATRR